MPRAWRMRDGEVDDSETRALLPRAGWCGGEKEEAEMPYALLPRGEHRATLEPGTDDELEASGWLESALRECLYRLLSVLSLGVLPLLARWMPHWRLKIVCRPCSLAQATTLLLKDSHGGLSVSHVRVQTTLAPLPPDLLFTAPSDTGSSYRYFIHNCVKFVWDCKKFCFKRLRGYDEDTLCSEFYDKFHGLQPLEQEQKREIYGPNTIEIEVKSYLYLFVNEVLNPFYIFQVFSMILWFCDNYVLYASCILVITMLSVAVALYETKRQQITLRDMVSQSNSVIVSVRRHDGTFEDVPASDLVPGDVIAIPPAGGLMACDAVLIAGHAILNESMLTGESVPETKTPLGRLEEVFSVSEHRRHALFCGTQVIQTRYYAGQPVLAVVIRTGFSTAKGELVRSILFPKPLGFKFYKDSLKFVAMLFALSALGMAYSIYTYIQRGAGALTTLVRALDIITIVVPPALPAAMTIGVVYAQSRLKRQKVFCISPPRINIGGKLKLIAFDKTGTLTEEGLDFWGIIPTMEGKFEELEHNVDILSETSPMKIAMATCHSLTVIEGEIRGDPMDLKMFQATNWELEEPGSDTSKFDLLNPTVVRPCAKSRNKGIDGDDNLLVRDSNAEENLLSIPLSPTKDSLLYGEVPLEVGILRVFTFSSSLQRMSVICRTLGAKRMTLYCKGAPEKIASLCAPSSVPGNFLELLKDYTLQGFRVIALSYRQLDAKLSWHHAQKIKRDQIEKDLTFLGLLIMQNTLKPETTPVIKELKDAKIRCVMVTGDNVLTALSVARDCGLVCERERVVVASGTAPDRDRHATLHFMPADVPPSPHANGDAARIIPKALENKTKPYHILMDGKTFAVVRLYFPELLPKILLRGTIFARMAPDQKTQLIESLQLLGYVVGMCGDGANDCGALKAADVGISLSDTEASVAAPFTSSTANITCVPTVMREGRCALVTSFSIFRFIALYSLTQFISVLILYTVDTNLTDQMFLYIDMGEITFIAIAMGYTGAWGRLVEVRPRVSLAGIPNAVSLLAQVSFVAVTQIAALLLLQQQKWYEAVESGEEIFPCWENTAVFLVSSFQYVFVALIVSDGPPFRQHFFNNYFYLCVVAVTIALNCFLLFNPFEQVATVMGLEKWQPNHHLLFRVTLLLFVLCNFFLALAFEMLVSRSRWLRCVARIIKRKHEPKNEFKRVHKQLILDSDWPPIDSPITSSVLLVQ